MAVREIYSGPVQGLYRAHIFLTFMDHAGGKTIPIFQRKFKYGADLVYLSPRLNNQVWHVHNCGVSVHYEKNKKSAVVRLFGEDIMICSSHRNSPISEVERIILQEAADQKYAQAEKNWREGKVSGLHL